MSVLYSLNQYIMLGYEFQLAMSLYINVFFINNFTIFAVQRKLFYNKNTISRYGKKFGDSGVSGKSENY